MGALRPPEPAAFFCALTFHDAAWGEIGEERLSERLGPPALRSTPLPFTHTAYYEEEMGQGLFKRLLCFEELRNPGELPSVKRWTNALEAELAEAGRRRVNLDPGYLTGAKVVLASTKDFAHRVYLGSRIYGEVTLLCKAGAYQTLPWTYPDYRQGAVLDFLDECRRWYLGKRRAQRAPKVPGRG